MTGFDGPACPQSLANKKRRMRTPGNPNHFSPQPLVGGAFNEDKQARCRLFGVLPSFDFFSEPAPSCPSRPSRPSSQPHRGVVLTRDSQGTLICAPGSHRRRRPARGRIAKAKGQLAHEAAGGGQRQDCEVSRSETVAAASVRRTTRGPEMPPRPIPGVQFSLPMETHDKRPADVCCSELMSAAAGWARRSSCLEADAGDHPPGLPAGPASTQKRT
ncbi:hypothetical protein CMUS01_09468 [Colletotrichum musicola]|uniref:Uncharacterized protein n=1 Tax=Colletotrichum musicola TaxID=2175873 RepID=A0A8H6NB55_9PEZI|nr:hypothetical protein CMUS01_09468 [Colletotrichum musicola]